MPDRPAPDPPQLDDVPAEVPPSIARLTHRLRVLALQAHPDLTGYLCALFPQDAVGARAARGR